MIQNIEGDKHPMRKGANFMQFTVSLSRPVRYNVFLFDRYVVKYVKPMSNSWWAFDVILIAHLPTVV